MFKIFRKSSGTTEISGSVELEINELVSAPLILSTLTNALMGAINEFAYNEAKKLIKDSGFDLVKEMDKKEILYIAQMNAGRDLATLWSGKDPRGTV